MKSLMPFLGPAMQPLECSDPGDFRSALSTFESLTQLVECAVPADFRGDHSGFTDALVAASKANDRQAIVAEFVAELGHITGACHTV
jgi:hypothetical protein